MKPTLYSLLLILTVSALLLAGCAPEPTLIPELTEEAAEEPHVTEPEAVTARFTIRADEALQGAVTALYTAFFLDELPAFVDADADLVVTDVVDQPFMPSEIPATFLPGAVMLPQNENAEVSAFIRYALSPDGQVMLIEIGALPASVTLTDQAGHTTQIDQPVRRLISSYGPATAIVYTVGAGETLVSASYLGARDPLGAAAMERIDPRLSDLIGDDFFSQEDFNVERAASLDPDLILTSARTAWLDTAAELGIPTILYEAETPELLIEAVLLTGELFGPNSAARAQAWAAYYDWVQTTIQDATADLPDEERPRVLFTGTQPARVASGDMYQTSIIEIAGGISVSAELTGYWNDVNLEQIAVWDPDLIIVPPYGGATVEAITDSPEWQILGAVQEGQVYQMPKLVVPWDTPAPDSVLAIVWLSQLLFPDQVELDCAEQAAYFYSIFYDYALSVEELDIICLSD